MEWECRDIDSCLHCPFPDCIQPFEFKYPSERKRIIYKTRVEAMNTKTGEYIYFKSVKDAARGIGVTYDKVRSRVDKNIDCNFFIVSNVIFNALNNLGVGKKCMCYYCAADDFGRHSKWNVL